MVIRFIDVCVRVCEHGILPISLCIVRKHFLFTFSFRLVASTFQKPIIIGWVLRRLQSRVAGCSGCCSILREQRLERRVKRRIIFLSFSSLNQFPSIMMIWCAATAAATAEVVVVWSLLCRVFFYYFWTDEHKRF